MQLFYFFYQDGLLFEKSSCLSPVPYDNQNFSISHNKRHSFLFCAGIFILDGIVLLKERFKNHAVLTALSFAWITLARAGVIYLLGGESVFRKIF